MKNTGVYIKVYLLAVLYFGCVLLLHGQERKIVSYANDNYWCVFTFDFTNKRYCYFYAKDEFVGTSVYSRGDIIEIGDTIILKSDFDNKNLPINIVSSTKNDVKTNIIYFKFIKPDNDPFNERAYKHIRSNLLYLVINDIDTVSLRKDTIYYPYDINSLYIIYKGGCYIYYKTQKYINTDKANEFNITFNHRSNYIYYKALNDTIVLSETEALWYLNDKNAFVKFNKVPFTEIKQFYESCECWNEEGLINFEVDTPPLGKSDSYRIVR